MKIIASKVSGFLFRYSIYRDNGQSETIELDTKTYFLHDICHFVIEKKLHIRKGFWGMLADGYAFNALSGKDNPQTIDLRFIEQIVGPIQSVYMGHFDKEELGAYIEHLNFPVKSEDLEYCLHNISRIMEKWDSLAVGEELELEW